MNVAVDLDGCLYDFVDAFHQSLIERHGTATPVHPDRWDFYTQYGMTGAEFTDQYNWALQHAALFTRNTPHPYGMRVLHQLVDAGHTIHIVTARGGTTYHDLAVEQTATWLKTHKVPYATLNVVPNVKAPVCLQLGVHVAVDDAPHHVDELVEAGVTAALFDQPWNRNHSTGRRIRSWAEFRDIVATATARTRVTSQ